MPENTKTWKLNQPSHFLKFTVPETKTFALSWEHLSMFNSWFSSYFLSDWDENYDWPSRRLHHHLQGCKPQRRQFLVFLWTSLVRLAHLEKEWNWDLLNHMISARFVRQGEIQWSFSYSCHSVKRKDHKTIVCSANKMNKKTWVCVVITEVVPTPSFFLCKSNPVSWGQGILLEAFNKSSWSCFEKYLLLPLQIQPAELRTRNGVSPLWFPPLHSQHDHLPLVPGLKQN